MKLIYLTFCLALLIFYSCNNLGGHKENGTLENKPAISDKFLIPSTISSEAKDALSQFSRKSRNIKLPASNDTIGWVKFYKENEKEQQNENEEIVELFNPTITKMDLGGIPVLDIKPQKWSDNRKVLVYVHGGAYTLFSASSTLTGSVPVAEETGLRIISVDYTVAPNANWKEITNQVVSVIKSLIKEGYNLKDIAIYGDSAGGGLASGAVLKARDEGVGLIGAVVLWSPWSDITENGDTYMTLKDTDPVLVFEKFLEHAAGAYAEPKDHKNPYVSPVYADYTQGFPATLIQVGSKEIFLSNAIRHYQVMDQAGIHVKIDPYDGMWHVFQAFSWDLPESHIARKKMSAFLKQELNY